MILERPDFKLQQWNERQDNLDHFENYEKRILPLCKGKVLDIGCGLGYLTKEISEQESVSYAIGIDKMETDQPQADSVQSGSKVSYIRTPVQKLLSGEIDILDTFDTIVSTEFLEHITKDEGEALCVWVKKHLAPQGTFIGNTPQRTGDAMSGNRYHLHEYTREELQELLSRHFSSVKIEYIGIGTQLWEAR